MQTSVKLFYTIQFVNHTNSLITIYHSVCRLVEASVWCLNRHPSIHLDIFYDLWQWIRPRMEQLPERSGYRAGRLRGTFKARVCVRIVHVRKTVVLPGQLGRIINAQFIFFVRRTRNDETEKKRPHVNFSLFYYKFRATIVKSLSHRFVHFFGNFYAIYLHN